MIKLIRFFVCSSLFLLLCSCGQPDLMKLKNIDATDKHKKNQIIIPKRMHE